MNDARDTHTIDELIDIAEEKDYHAFAISEKDRQSTVFFKKCP